jgi:hypothetical protein
MTKPTLDEIEVDILKQRLDLNLNKWRAPHINFPEKDTYNAEIERDQKRYHELTGRWYTFRHADERQLELPIEDNHNQHGGSCQYPGRFVSVPARSSLENYADRAHPKESHQ